MDESGNFSQFKDIVNIMENDCRNFEILHDIFRNTNYTGNPEPVPTWEIYVKCIFYALILGTAFFGNLSVLVIVTMNRNMRSTTNIFIANLAIGDMFIAVCPMWVKLVESITMRWPFGEFICKLWPFLQVTSMCGSVFTLTAIACDRFFAVVFPLKSRATKRNVFVIIAVIWVLSLAIGIPEAFAYNMVDRQWNDYHEIFCYESWVYFSCNMSKRTLYPKIYWTFVCAVTNWLPMIIMTAVYISIAIIMYRRNRIVPNSNSYGNVQQRSMRKVLRMLFIVLMAFIVCWVPFQINVVYAHYRPSYQTQLPSWFRPVQFGSILLTHLNSALNPVIYAGLNESFRKGFVYVFVCWKRKYYYDRPTSHASGTSSLRLSRDGRSRPSRESERQW
ncbi:trissin receptor-like isoform X2 [Lineus longissimus]|uniref:trissin receptor-like isoform X2 n=2 Tax=Lineus longissimus TaxID=88925 RepID=UPI00315C9E6B